MKITYQLRYNLLIVQKFSVLYQQIGGLCVWQGQTWGVALVFIVTSLSHFHYCVTWLKQNKYEDVSSEVPKYSFTRSRSIQNSLFSFLPEILPLSINNCIIELYTPLSLAWSLDPICIVMSICWQFDTSVWTRKMMRVPHCLFIFLACTIVSVCRHYDRNIKVVWYGYQCYIQVVHTISHDAISKRYFSSCMSYPTSIVALLLNQ